MGKFARKGIRAARKVEPYKRKGKNDEEDMSLDVAVPQSEEELEKIEAMAYEEVVKKSEKPETRGAILQRHKREYKELRDRINQMKKERRKLSKRNKEQNEKRKEMTKQMKQMMQELEERHKRELQEFDEATKKPQLRSVRLELQSINLNFGNLSLSGKDDE